MYSDFLPDTQDKLTALPTKPIHLLYLRSSFHRSRLLQTNNFPMLSSHPTLLHQLLSSSSPVSHTALPDFITAAFTGFQGPTQNPLLGLLFSCSRLPSD